MCVHAASSNIHTLLERNDIGNDDVYDYSVSITIKSTPCNDTSKIVESRKISFSSISVSFNGIFCINHFYMDRMNLFHVIDISSQISAATVVPDASLKSAVIAF